MTKVEIGKKKLMKEDSGDLKLVSLKDASRTTPYGADYLGLLVRKGKLDGYKVGGKWYTTDEAVQKYLRQAAESSYEHQRNLNVKIPAEEIRKAKVNFRWAIVLLSVLVFCGLLVWKIMDDNKLENIRTKYRIVEDGQGNLLIYTADPSKVGSVKVLRKE